MTLILTCMPNSYSYIEQTKYGQQDNRVLVTQGETVQA